ncbi:reprolysin-like metallopeptidase [Pseudomonas sp. LP_7_YM]|uniref:reprolysin-like metallopeptidase n=1 Tax=Pseudomonas sp. LP_7_YM TaxID=2485137 RepID=UPI00105DCC07|nr:hypothetical protein [Pseudomonas sp. LP_7_YM]TDV64361.1 reprolysin-like metallo-peptidase family M12B [Pseudomonas sp. LP_7_YM]
MTTATEFIRIHVYYHDDVSASTRRIVPRNYLKDCITELERVARRPFVIEYKHSIPGVTDIEYQGGDPRHALNRWISAALGYQDRHIRASERIQRYLLVTQQSINDEVLGIAQAPGGCAIASLTNYQTIAHELGHTFGMRHEDAELHHNAFGLECATYGYPEQGGLRSNCYQYSIKNRENMARYFAQYVD